MKRGPPHRLALLFAFLASVAMAKGPEEKIVIRTLLISDNPGNATDSVFVSGQVATVLHFEQDVDPAKTKLLGWEGRFEPLLVGSKKVVLEPLHDLDNDERIPLLVTLADGTEISFLVRPPRRKEWGWTDHQVNVFKNRESFNSMYSSLADSLERERKLSEENERFKKEENSVDHAFATLLVNGHVEQTPFVRKRTAVLKNEDMDIKVEVFAGPGKAAAVVELTNTYNVEPWRFRDARLTADFTSHTARPFALRMNRVELAPGQSGKIAIVADKSAFTSKEGLVDLALEIFREDGLQQVVVMLDHTLVQK
jgi:uncharacterized protein (TIGR02268 family)